MQRDEYGIPKRRILFGNVCVTDLLMVALFVAFAIAGTWPTWMKLLR